MAKAPTRAKRGTKGAQERLSSTRGLTQLGSGRHNKPSRSLEAFDFRERGRDTIVTFRCEEFTCHCPLTGQPDFARIEIQYIPRRRALESKSLKNYLWSFRDTGAFHEDLVNRILDDIDGFLEPKWIRVVGHFNIRGGIAIDVSTEKRRGE